MSAMPTPNIQRPFEQVVGFGLYIVRSWCSSKKLHMFPLLMNGNHSRHVYMQFCVVSRHQSCVWWIRPFVWVCNLWLLLPLDSYFIAFCFPVTLSFPLSDVSICPFTFCLRCIWVLWLCRYCTLGGCHRWVSEICSGFQFENMWPT